MGAKADIGKLATWYVSKAKGYKMIKELAEQGHPDGMCLYGKSVVTRICER